MAKGLISIFALPYEIDNLQTTLYNLRRNYAITSGQHEFGFDITLCLSDELTNWEFSLPKSYFEDKFSQITEKLCDWATPQSIKIEYGNSILGCVSQRRHSLKFLDKYDFTMWLDNDMFFGDYLLSYVGTSVNMLLENGTEYFVLTPQITRQWDETWDVLVNKNLLNRQLNDNLTVDMFDLGLTQLGDVGLRPIENFKAAGGWCTTISNDLLELTGIPESFGHYGLEDTYVLVCADLLRRMNRKEKPQQFVIDNLVVGENHKYQTYEYLKNQVKSIDKKDEFRQIATRNFNIEVEKFIQRMLQP
jgi:hypothetical protein